MTTAYHTPHDYQDPLDAAQLNIPLGELDSAIGTLVAGLAASALPITTTDDTAASGQKIVPVAATTAFIVGQPVWIGDIGGTYEIGLIASIQAGVSLTMVANLANTYASGKIVSGSPSELADARAGFATLAARLASGIGTAGAAFPGSPASGDLFRHTGRSGALYRYTGAAWVQLNVPAVTAFWGTPSTDDRCYRSDRDIDYFYDGTRWLSTKLYVGYLPATKVVSPVSPPQASQLTVANGPSWNTLYNEWLVEFFVSALTSAINGASNLWTVRLVEPGSTLATITTDENVNAGIWFQHRAAVGALIPAHNAKALTVQTTGSPGTLDYAAMYTYRLVG